MSKSVPFLLTITAIACLCAPGSAANLKVGVVNLQKILQASPQVAQVKARLKKEFEPQQQKILAKQRKLQALEREMGVSTTHLGPGQQESLQMKITTMQHELKQMRGNFLDDLNLRRNQALGKLQRLAIEEVKSYAKEHGYDLVIGNGVFYSSQSVNITDDIIQRLKLDFKASPKTDMGTAGKTHSQ